MDIIVPIVIAIIITFLLISKGEEPNAIFLSVVALAVSAMPEGLLHLEAGIQTLQQDVLDTCARKGSCANAVEGLKFLIF